MISFSLSPLVLGFCGDRGDVWISKVAAWFMFAREHELRFNAPEDHWDASVTDGCQPGYAAIEAMLEGGEIVSRYGPSEGMQLFSGLLALTDLVPADWVATQTSTTGCMAALACSTLRESVLLSFAQLPEPVVCAGSAVVDQEEAHVGWIREAGEQLEDGESWTAVQCAPFPDDSLRSLPVSEALEVPTLALALEMRQLPVDIQQAMASRVRFLPNWGRSVATLPAGVAERAYAVIALLCLPVERRPRGIDEHPLRVGAGPHDPPRTSRWGSAYRADLRQRGEGWRLHYWRLQDELVVWGAVTHNFFDIGDE